jgi:signal transduction histidine kinase
VTRSPFSSGPLYLRLTAVVLGAVVCGVVVLLLHALALARTTTPLRLDALRLLSDDLAQRISRGEAPSLPSPYAHAIVGADGNVLSGEAPPRWFDGWRTLPSGERCGRFGNGCFAVRPLAGGGRLVFYLRPQLLVGPFTVALLGSVVAWIAISALAGLLLLRTMREADASRRRLVAALAHDLGTPLTSIRGFAETLLAAPGEADRRSLSVLYREALRMQRLVEDMLALSRLEAGRLDLVRRPFDLREALRSAADRAAMAYGEAPAVALPESSAVASADRDRVEQVLANVVDNAYRHGGGAPRLALRRDGAGFVIEVADEGPGLSADARAHLFEAFARGDGAKGSGLGLAVAREIVVRHGGRLDVSGPPGCRVTIELPA